MAKKTSVITIDQLRSAPDIDALEPLPGLLAETERCQAEVDRLDRERDALLANKASFSPYKLGKLEEAYQPHVEALALARQQVDEARARLQIEIDAMMQPIVADALTRLMKALKPAATVDAEVHDLESVCARFLPFYSRIRLKRTDEELRGIARHLAQRPS